MEILVKEMNAQDWRFQIFGNRLETVGGRWRRDSGSSVAPENKPNQHGGGGRGVERGAAGGLGMREETGEVETDTGLG